MTSNSEKLCAIVKSLDGSNVSPADIEWANDIPAGRELLDWIANQLPHSTLSNVSSALRQIALESEESDMFDEAVKSSSTDNVEGIVVLPPYVIPSIQRIRDARVEQELELLQDEAARLKARLQSMKTASQHLVQTTKQLQAVVQETDGVVRRQRETLDELSITVNKGLSKSVAEAQKLLGVSITDSNTVQAYKDELSALTSTRTSIIETVIKAMHSIDEIQQSLPKAADIMDEASRLSGGLKRLRKPGARKEDHGEFLVDDILDFAIHQRLLVVCDKLEGSEDGQDIDSILADLGIHLEDQDAPAGLCDVNVKDEIETAWKLDQLAILAGREKVVDEAQKACNEQLLPRLGQLEQKLSSKVASNFEAEALVNALLEELEDAIDDAQDAKSPAESLQSTPNGVREADSLLQSTLTSTLKDLKEYRPINAPPLALLERTDLEGELNAISERLSQASKAEEEWLSSLSLRLPDVHKPLLSAVYANSPVNTSPPFAAPPDLAKLEISARSQIESMTRSIITLQKDVEMSDRAKRKLSNFVESRGR